MLARKRSTQFPSKELTPVKYMKASNGRKVPCYLLSSFDTGTAIGGGGFGAVVKGIDRNKSPVAIKLFYNIDTDSKREVDFLMEHSHRSQHIVELLGIIVKETDDKTKPNLGYVMPYMEHGSLDSEIFNPKKTYSLFDSCLLIQKIASGLAYLHQHNIMHRDIKPQNILLSTDHHPILADFGLTRRDSEANRLPQNALLPPANHGSLLKTDADDNTSGFVGTHGYMAPEILMTRNYGPSVDIYSLGITIWEIIHRKHAENYLYANKDMSGFNYEADLEKTSNELFDLIARCLDENAATRPSARAIVDFFGTNYCRLVPDGLYETHAESDYIFIRRMLNHYAGVHGKHGVLFCQKEEYSPKVKLAYIRDFWSVYSQQLFGHQLLCKESEEFFYWFCMKLITTKEFREPFCRYFWSENKEEPLDELELPYDSQQKIMRGLKLAFELIEELCSEVYECSRKTRKLIAKNYPKLEETFEKALYETKKPVFSTFTRHYPAMDVSTLLKHCPELEAEMMRQSRIERDQPKGVFKYEKTIILSRVGNYTA